MTRIESQKVEINKPASEIFTFLSSFHNFEKIMPEQVVGWNSTEDDCFFHIKGMADLTMKYSEKIPNSSIKIVPNGKTPFDFVLQCIIGETLHATSPQGTTSIVQLAFDADLNPFLKMMAEKPLTNFLNLLVNKLKEI